MELRKARKMVFIPIGNVIGHKIKFLNDAKKE